MNAAANIDVDDALAALQLAFERLGAAQRRTLGVTMSEEAVLLFLARGVTAPGELSRAIGMTSAGMTNLLDRLETDGLIRRMPHATDKRRVLLTLTKKGFRSRQALDEAHEELAELAHQLPGDAAETIAHFLMVSAEHLLCRAHELEELS